MLKFNSFGACFGSKAVFRISNFQHQLRKTTGHCNTKPKFEYRPDRTDPNFFQIIELGLTRSPCQRPKPVWSIPVLGHELHPGLSKIYYAQVREALFGGFRLLKVENNTYISRNQLPKKCSHHLLRSEWPAL